MTILVTGASGMLGRALLAGLSKKNEVMGISKSGRENSRRCDLAKAEEVSSLFDRAAFDAVIHAAAYSDVDGCERNPREAYEANATGTQHISQACGRKGVPLIYVSTDYVFDGQKKSPYEESDRTCPVNVYGLTKLAGEHHAAQSPAVSVVVRTSWLFGPGNPSNFVNAVTERLKRESEVRVLDDQEDSPTYVVDLAAALEKITDWAASQAKRHPASPVREIFHVCNAGSATRLSMTLKIRDWLSLRGVKVRRLEAQEVKNRPALRPAYAVMSTRHYQRHFNAKLRPWEESLREYLLRNSVIPCAS